MSTTPSILLVGLGGAGCGMVSRIAAHLPPVVRVALIDTDASILNTTAGQEAFQIGRPLTRGMGTAGELAVGLAAVEADEPALRRLFTGYSLVVLVTGLGGGMGSGGAAPLASIALDAGATVLSFATIPFSHEGERRKRQATEALEKLAVKSHGLVVVENDLLALQVAADASLSAAFSAADEWIAGSLRALASVFTPGALVPVDPAALKTILEKPGSPTLFSYGVGEGSGAALIAAKAACDSSLAHGPGAITKVGSLFVQVTGGLNMSATDAFEAVSIIRKKFGGEKTTLLGACIKPELGDRVEVAVLGASLPVPKPAAKTKKGAKGTDPNQPVFVFATEESIRRGIFGNTPSIFRDGEDVDVPTYIRRSVRLTPAS